MFVSVFIACPVSGYCLCWKLQSSWVDLGVANPKTSEDHGTLERKKHVWRKFNKSWPSVGVLTPFIKHICSESGLAWLISSNQWCSSGAMFGIWLGHCDCPNEAWTFAWKLFEHLKSFQSIWRLAGCWLHRLFSWHLQWAQWTSPEL